MTSIHDRLPYPGLRAFNRDEADLFFGRDGAVNDLILRLSQTRFLAVLGASGTGKSSLVRTGMLDGLELGLHPAGANWLFCDMAPGGQPIRNLARGLLQLVADLHHESEIPEDDVESLEWFLRRGPRSLIEWVEEGHLPEDVQLLVLVDQFEELFRFADYEGREVAEAFVKLLIHASREADSRIHVVITMRSEYLGACVLVPDLAETINTGSYLTPRMDRDSCRQAIEGPARMFGSDIEPGLVMQLLNDLDRFAPFEHDDGEDQLRALSRRADQLPVMQHVLNRVWQAEMEDGTPGPLRLETYQRLGGIRGALNQHSAEVLDSLPDKDAPAVEKIFRALVDGATIATGGRRALSFGDLVRETGVDTDTARRIVETFRRSDVNFLRPPPDVPLGDKTVVDISHESLIRQWSRLSDWLMKEARGAAVIRRVAESQSRHDSGEGDLLSGLDLANIASWWDDDRPTVEWAQRYTDDFAGVESFLRRSQDAQTTKENERRNRFRRERMRLWSFSGVTSVIALVAGFAFWDASQQRDEAQRLEADALANEQDMLEATEALAIDLIERLERDSTIPVQAKYGLIQNTEDAFRAIAANRADDPAFIEQRGNFLLASLVALGKGGFWTEAESYAQRLEAMLLDPPENWSPGLDFEIRSAVAISDAHRLLARIESAERWGTIAREKLVLADPEAPEFLTYSALVHEADAKTAQALFRYERALSVGTDLYRLFSEQLNALRGPTGERLRETDPVTYDARARALADLASSVIRTQQLSTSSILQIDAHERFGIDYDLVVERAEEAYDYLQAEGDVPETVLAEGRARLFNMRATQANDNDAAAPDALEQIDGAVGIIEDLSAADPGNRAYRKWLMHMLILRGDYAGDAGQISQAQIDLDAALDILLDLRARGITWTERADLEPWIYFNRWQLAQRREATEAAQRWERAGLLQSVASLRKDQRHDPQYLARLPALMAFLDVAMHSQDHLSLEEIEPSLEAALVEAPGQRIDGEEAYFWLAQRQFIHRQLVSLGPEKLGMDRWQEAFDAGFAEADQILEIAPGAHRALSNQVSFLWTQAVSRRDAGQREAALGLYRQAFEKASIASFQDALRDAERDAIIDSSVRLARNLVINGGEGLFGRQDLARIEEFLDHHLADTRSARSIVSVRNQFDALANELSELAENMRTEWETPDPALVTALVAAAGSLENRIDALSVDEVSPQEVAKVATADIDEVRAQLRRLEIDKELLDDGLVYWVRPPLMDAVWQTLEGKPFQDTRAILADIPRANEITYIRSADLPFYESGRLIEVQLGVGPRANIFAYILTDEGTIRRLDGTSPPIHDANRAVPIRLDTSEQVAAYLRFFTHYVNASEGSFSIVESTSDIPFAESADAEEFERAQKVLRPFVVWRHTEKPDHWQAAATVYYARNLYHAIFEIPPTGVPEMLSDTPLAVNLEASIIRVRDRELGIRLGGESIGSSVDFGRLELTRHEVHRSRAENAIALSLGMEPEKAAALRRDFIEPMFDPSYVSVYGEGNAHRNAVAYELLKADVDNDLALRLAEMAGSAAPESPHVMDALGWAMLENGDVDKAIDVLERARDLDPTKADIRAQLARAYRLAGREDEAEIELDTGFSMTVDAFWTRFLEAEKAELLGKN